MCGVYVYRTHHHHHHSMDVTGLLAEENARIAALRDKVEINRDAVSHERVLFSGVGDLITAKTSYSWLP